MQEKNLTCISILHNVGWTAFDATSLYLPQKASRKRSQCSKCPLNRPIAQSLGKREVSGQLSWSGDCERCQSGCRSVEWTCTSAAVSTYDLLPPRLWRLLRSLDFDNFWGLQLNPLTRLKTKAGGSFVVSYFTYIYFTIG